MMATRTKNISNSAETTDNVRDISKSSSKWGSKEISQDIMESVLQRLPLSDYLRCKAVCPSWREAVESANATKHCRPLPQPRACIFFQRDRSLLDCVSRKAHKLNLPDDDPNDKFVGVIQPGWLIKVDWGGSIFTLLNPVSRAAVKLPRYNQDPATPFIKRAVASSVPFIVSNQCIVACHSSDDGSSLEDITKEALEAKTDVGARKSSLAICRPTDKKWTPIHHEQLLEDIRFVDNKLYAATKNPSQFLMVFHFDAHVDDHLRYRVECSVSIEPGPVHDRFERMFKIKKSGVYLSQDFSTSKELFMITFADSFFYDLYSWDPYFADFEAFQVFKLVDDDDANNNSGVLESRWVEIVNYRDRLSVISEKLPEFVDLNYDCNINIGSSVEDDDRVTQWLVQCLGMVRRRCNYLSLNPW